jgi:hypothetical protein
MAIRRAASARRSARQTEDARFWLAPGPAIYYPLVRQLAGARNLDLLDSARFMALIAVAKSDAFVAVFDAKYHDDFWRPITAIRNGDLDDNAGTGRDATWQPLEATPMHPEYPCAHCIQSGSVAAVVKAVLGTVDIPEVALTSPTAPGVTHRWSNLDAYTDEVTNARIWAGYCAGCYEHRPIDLTAEPSPRPLFRDHPLPLHQDPIHWSCLRLPWVGRD